LSRALCLAPGVELDADQRELRIGGAAVPLQARVFSVLLFLVEQRDRVVTRDELIAAVWQGATVSDSAIQRAISLARSALADAGELIVTYPRQGYRFVGEIAAAEPPVFRPRYTRAGDVHIAYATEGDGPIDIVLVNGWTFPTSCLFTEPRHLQTWTELSRLGRVVSFDKRGTGMSDRVKKLPSLAERMEDVRAVLDDLGSARAIAVGISEGGPLAIQLAVEEPQRLAGLVLSGAFARMGVGPGYPFGWKTADVERLRGYIRREWGGGKTALASVASCASDPAIQAWCASLELNGASPGAALELLEMNLAIDVRNVLDQVGCPTVVLHRERDSVIDPRSSELLAERIPGAERRSLGPGDHLLSMSEDGRQALLSAVAQLIEAEISER